MAKIAAEQVYDSSLPVVDPVPQSPALLQHGEYTVHPMSTCNEQEIAVLFSKVCQRNNPVLQGRPFKDLELLGRAMFRKCATLGMGQVVMHDGKAVGLGCGWDLASGGVWVDSGLPMPDSLAAHAAIGKACMDALPQRGTKTFFIAFYGMLPGHSPNCFGIMAMSHFCMAKALGFNDSFQFTLLQALKGKGVFSDDKKNADSLNWSMLFTDVASDRSEVLDELKELAGSINCQLTNLDYNLTDEYMTMAAATSKIKTREEMRARMDTLATNHLEFLRSPVRLTSRL